MTTRTSRPKGREQGLPAPSEAPSGVEAESADPLALEQDGLRYEADKPPARNGKKVVLSVRYASDKDGAGFFDRVDLYTFRSRHGFAQSVADLFGKTADQILGHLALLLDQIERTLLTKDRPKPVVLTEARLRAAEALLEGHDLLDQAALALEALGYVGEDENKRLAFLVATSRLLSKPLSAILFAESGTGKSELLDRLAELFPPESVEFLSRLTPHALYYAGAEHLRNKLVIVDEQAGATDADYAIRTLQTKGFLRLALAVKGKTESFEAHGPIALLSGTTRDDLNPENLSRCLELKLDDSPEQTKRVQDAQRRAWTGEARKKIDVEVWQDAQRLLEPLDIIIPFAPKLAYPARTTTDRRNNQKLLTLVAAHALLHQRQRERDAEGRILATREDYAAIHALLSPQVEAELEGLSPRAARLYRILAEKDEPLSRRDAAKRLGWGYNTAKRALEELQAHELVRVASRDMPRLYQLVPDSGLAKGARLTNPKKV
jgi:DNA primase